MRKMKGIFAAAVMVMGLSLVAAEALTAVLPVQEVLLQALLPLHQGDLLLPAVLQKLK